MDRLPVRRAVVRVPVVGVEEPARVGRLRRDAAAELINSQTNYIQVYILAPGVDAEHPEEYEHVERDGQRDQREDHPTVGANSEQPMWKSNFGRPTPSTRRRSNDRVCSMAWRVHAIDATFPRNCGGSRRSPLP